MSTISGARRERAAVQGLFESLMRLSRSIRARSGDRSGDRSGAWGHASGEVTRGDIVTIGAIARAERIRPGQIASTMGVGPPVVSRWDRDAIARAGAAVNDLADLLQDHPDLAETHSSITTATSKDADA